MNNNRFFYLIMIGFLIYIALNFSMSNYSQERYVFQGKNPVHPISHVTTPNTNSIYSSKFRSNLPEKNIKFRPENELGNISSDHLVYDT